MRRFLPLIAPLVVIALAGCAAQPQPPAASGDDKASQAFSTYLSARFAADEHDRALLIMLPDTLTDADAAGSSSDDEVISTNHPDC